LGQQQPCIAGAMASVLHPGVDWRRTSLLKTSVGPTSPAIAEEEEGDDENGRAQEQEADHHKHKANLERMHQEAHAVLQHMVRQARGDECILKHFISWITTDDDKWRNFWSRFRADGTMTWKEFEKYVHWDCKWTGETEEVFGLLDQSQCGHITAGRCLKLKRWWQSCKDKKRVQ